MKINKNKILTEAIDTNEIVEEVKEETIEEAVDLAEKKIEVDIPDDFDIEDASRGDLARMIKAALATDAQAAGAEGEAVAAKLDTPKTDQAIEQNAAQTEEVAELVVNPYGTASISKIETILQAALETTLANQAGGIEEPSNVLLYGAAGAGKTAIVRQWCKAHNVNMFDCKASSLDVATVGGIPYPVKDDKTGRWTQKPIVSSYWDGLFKPNTVLFLDEFNRANSNVRGTLLALINEKELPMSEDGPNGKVVNKHKFDNLLFTVVAINPAGGVFQEINELDLAEISRFALKQKVELDGKELLIHLNRVYDTVLKNPVLDQALHDRWEGQQNLANVLLSDKTFLFDSDQDQEEIATYNNENGEMISPLSYRSFFQNLLGCNGTKADYLKKLDWTKFSSTRTRMIKNILANYTDKPLKGNKVFSKAQQQAAAQVSDVEKQRISVASQSTLNSFAQDLED